MMNITTIIDKLLKLERGKDDGSQHKFRFEVSSHPKGSVLAPMAGLVVKVLVENGASVEGGQPVLVLEAMKMEVQRSNALLSCCSLNF